MGDYKDIKFLFDYIESWYNNYCEIINKYPNGDLGAVIENNKMYKQMEEILSIIKTTI